MNRIQHRRTPPVPTLLLAAALLSTAASAVSLVDQKPSPAMVEAINASPQPPLRSRAELDAWLKANAGKPTPFDAFSAGGRERALASLDFGDQGLNKLPFEEISWQLDPTQATALLKLFDRESWAEMLDSHPTTAPWKGDPITPSEMDRRYLNNIEDQDGNFDKNGLQYERNVSGSYRRHFPASLLAQTDQLDNADLLIFARAAASTVRFTTAEPETQDLLSLLPLLQKRGLDITPLAVVAQRSLLALGKLDQARALTGQYPSVKFGPVPAVTVGPERLPAGPKWWRLSHDGTAITAESVDMSVLQIFVLAGCHFSIDAAEDVRNDPELAPIFARHAHWLGEPLGREDVDAWKQWNRTLPDTPMYLVTKRSDWSMFPSWNMPTYAIVRHGKVIDQTTGSWRNYPEARVALVEMLRRHGLLASADGNTTSISAAKLSD